MKKNIIFAFVIVFIFMPIFQVSADSGNPHYDKFLELKRQAEEANAAGEYDKAYELSLQAEEELRLAEEYRDLQIGRSSAKWLLKSAQERITYIENTKLNETNQEAYNNAKENYEKAEEAYDEGEYEKSEEYSQQVLDELEGIKLAGTDNGTTDPTNMGSQYTGTEGVKPKYYVVRLVLELRECLWNIAAYDFIYGDGYKWGILYEANKHKLLDPNNPDLIVPGMIIEIPELEGEKREGTYDPDKN